MIRRASVILLAVACALSFAPAHALDDSCSIDGGSASSPHMEDLAGDQQANLDSGVPTPDSTDILSSWFARGDDGRITANIALTSLTGTELSFRYYVQWSHRGADPALKSRRFVTVQPRPYGNIYRYGYLDTTATPQTLVTEGETTGTVTTGAPALLSIVVPMDKLGDPQPGDLLIDVLAQARVLAGNPGAPSPVPPPPPGTPSGVVSTVDDTTNGDSCVDVLF